MRLRMIYIVQLSLIRLLNCINQLVISI
eukprot:gene17184-22702_t